MSKWQTVPLSDVAIIERSGIQPEMIKDGTIYIGLEHIEKGGRFTEVTPVGKGDLASSKFQFTAEHILYGKLRPYLAKIACPDFQGICSTDILPILPTSNIDRKFLFHFLSQPKMIDYANSQAVGVNLPRLSPSVLAKFLIPLPPIAEQKRIAEILDRTQSLISKRKEAIAKLDTLTQSIFLEMFGDPVKNENNLTVVRLGDLTKISSGSTPSRKIPEYFNGNIPWVKTTEVNGSLITDTEEKITDSALKNSSCHLYPVGSILIALYGQGKTRGQCAVLGIEATTNQACAALFPNQNYDTNFLFAQLSMSYNRLRAMARGGNQENLNLGLISEFTVLLPPLQLQKEFAQRVEAVEKLKATHRESLSQLEALFASLQHRAFRGEL